MASTHGSWTGPWSIQEHKSHDDGGTGSPPVCPDLLVSLASLKSLCLGRGRRELCNPRSSRTPGLPYPCAQFPFWASSGGIHKGGSTPGPKGVGEGQARAGQRVWTREGCSARPEETVAQCPGLPQAYSGLLFPDSPSWWKSRQHLRSADPSVQGETTGQGGPDCLGHTVSESLWQHPWLPTWAQPSRRHPKGQLEVK